MAHLGFQSALLVKHEGGPMDTRINSSQESSSWGVADQAKSPEI